MATASSQEEELVAMPPSRLEGELVCAICLKLFQEPHILGCSHSYCLSCLKGCVREGREEGTCPECRGPFRLRNVIYNRSLGKLAEELRSLRRDRPFAARLHVCKEHDEPLKLFCSQDEEPICVICRDLPQHRGHEFVPTKTAVEQAQDKLKPYLNALSRELNIAMDCKSFQERQMEALEYCAEDNLSYIFREFAVLHHILDTKERELRKNFKDIKRKNKKEMGNAFKSLKNEISLLSDCIEKIKAALATTDHVGFLKDFKNLMEKIQSQQVNGVKDDSESKNETIGTAEDSSETKEESESEEEKSEPEEERSEPEEERSESEEEKSESEEEESEEEESEYEEEESEYEEEEDHKEDEDGYYSTRVVFVEQDLKEFKRILNFKDWKEMLKCLKCSNLLEKDKEQCPTEVKDRDDDHGLQFNNLPLLGFNQASKLEVGGVSQTTFLGKETDLYTLFPTRDRKF